MPDINPIERRRAIMRYVKGAVIIILLGAVVGLVAYVSFRPSPKQGLPASQSVPVMTQRVELKTQDSVAVVGDYYVPASTSVRGLLLLHMMPADRASWRAFAEKMQSAGWHVLAIDLRGHGESQGGPPGASLAKGGPDGYKRFSDAEHQASRFDIEAGVEFLKEALRQSSGESELYLGGASIGANLALQYLAEHADAKAALLLSPGLDYRGVTTESAARSLKPGQSVYYIASRDDQYSADTIQRLYDVTPSGVRKEIKFFETAGHGTTIFEREPAFMDELAGWLANR